MEAQISLPIRLRDWAGLDNFYFAEGSSASPLLQLLREDHWRHLHLYGLQGSGKTHLLQAASRHWQEKLDRQVFYLPLTDFIQADPGLLEGLEQFDLVALDDLDEVAGKPAWEEGLFHLYNRLQDQGTHLLTASRTNPAHLPLGLADLQSRLLAGATWKLEPLPENDLRQALSRRAERLGFELSSQVSDYLFNRYSRDAKTLFTLLEQLDSYSFNRQRPLTLPLIRSFLAEYKAEV